MRTFRFFIVLLAQSLLGCSSLFLYPDKNNYFPDVNKFVVLEEGMIPTSGGEQLHYWIVPAQNGKVLDKKPKGLVIQVHGNAQNLSSHVRGLGWITEAGYNLAIFDYRGYGKSTGKPSLDSAYDDVGRALDYLTTTANPHNLPVFFYGQSLGGTLLLKQVSRAPQRWSPRLIVVESSFFSYTGIAREKLAYSWITWPFQWLSYLVLSDKLGLKEAELKTIAPTPVLMFYSKDDPVVPISHGRKISEALLEPKKFVEYPERGHIAAMWVQKGKLREILLSEMERTSKSQ